MHDFPYYPDSVHKKTARPLRWDDEVFIQSLMSKTAFSPNMYQHVATFTHVFLLALLYYISIPYAPCMKYLPTFTL